MATVKLKGIYKAFTKDDYVIANLDLEVKNGEFLVLVGPSGCGKSTLLRMIAGLEHPTLGHVSIDEKIVNEIPPKDRDIAMVFQNYALYPHMNVYDNLGFSLKLRKVSKSKIKKTVEETAKMLEIDNLLKRKPKELSGGQRQRVALGRAIVRNPKVFLFDEPLSNLDAKLRNQMRSEIKKFHKQLGVTMIYVTHDQVEAMTMGDRIVILKDGIIQQVGTPYEVYQDPINKFVAGFIGSPAMNFIKGNLEQGLFVTNDLHIKLPKWNKIKNLEGKEIILGIRPGDITIDENDGIPLLLEFYETLGSETILYLKLGDSSLVATIPTESNLKSSDIIKVQFNADKCLLFDSSTNQRIL